jgi:hypothetical protein
MEISNKNVRQFDELNELRIAFNSKLLEITNREYAKPISISDMVSTGGEQVKEMFILKWDSCFQPGLMTRLNNKNVETEYIHEDEKDEILAYLRIKELCNN